MRQEFERGFGSRVERGEWACRNSTYASYIHDCAFGLYEERGEGLCHAEDADEVRVEELSRGGDGGVEEWARVDLTAGISTLLQLRNRSRGRGKRTTASVIDQDIQTSSLEHRTDTLGDCFHLLLRTNI